MSSHEPPASVLLDRTNANWYFFQNSSVGGPSSLEQILRLSQQGHDGRETLICRTDFKKWYPLREISHLVKAHEDFGRDTAEEVRQFRSVTTRHIETLEHLHQKTEKLEVRSIPDAHLDMESTQALLPTVNVTPVRYSHYLLRGRLRLGEIRNSFFAAWFFMPITFGLYWFFWMKRSFADLTWHAHNSFETKKMRAFWLSVFPGLHIWFCYRLAKLLREAEEQNSYHKTRPLWVAFLSIIPPLAVFHLQRKMNYHWRLHVEHFNAQLH